MSPNLQTATRFIAILGVEWSTLTLLEPSPAWVKIATLALCAAVLGVLEFRSWIEKKAKWAFLVILGSLIAVYLIVCGSAYLLAAPQSFSFEPVIPWFFAAFGVLGVAIAFYTSIKAKRLSAQAPVSLEIDGQTRLDLSHLLYFALSQANFWTLDALIELSQSSEVIDGIKTGGADADNARRFFIDHARRELGSAGGFRQSDFINLMATAEGEAERELEATPPEKRPDIDPLVLRKYLISERQFTRALQYLRRQRSELKNALAGARTKLSELSQEREKR